MAVGEASARGRGPTRRVARRHGAARRRPPVGRFALLLLLVVATSGCVTRNASLAPVDEALAANDPDGAYRRWEQVADSLYPERDEVLYHLDRGMLALYADRPEESVAAFGAADRRIEELYARSISQAALTLVINDTVEEYRAADFEDIYLNLFAAVAYLQVGDVDGAFVEIRRVNEKLTLLEDRYQGFDAEVAAVTDPAAPDQSAREKRRETESRFYNSALARYVSLNLYRSEGNWDGARIDFEEMEEAFGRQQNLYDFPLPIGRTAIEPSAAGRVAVVAFAGESPVIRDQVVRVTTLENEVVVSYDRENAGGFVLPEGTARFTVDGVEPGYNIPVHLPWMELRGSRVRSVRLTLDGRPVGELGMLEDLERVAEYTFRQTLPLTYIRTIARAVTKGIVAQEGNARLAEIGATTDSPIVLLLSLLGRVATDVAVEGTERADLRLSRYFPAHAWAGEFDVPPGTYTAVIEYVGSGGPLWKEELGAVTVVPATGTLVVGAYPR